MVTVRLLLALLLLALSVADVSVDLLLSPVVEAARLDSFFLYDAASVLRVLLYKA
jgi:hypothetical protein